MTESDGCESQHVVGRRSINIADRLCSGTSALPLSKVILNRSLVGPGHPQRCLEDAKAPFYRQFPCNRQISLVLYSTIQHRINLSIMPKPSNNLRKLIGAKSSVLRCWPPATFEAVVAEIEKEATERGLDQKPWIAITIATVMTLGSPESVTAVAKHLVKTTPPNDVVAAVEFAREVGVMGMAMNGVWINARQEI